MEHYAVKRVESDAEREAALAIRNEVFIREQGVAPELEHDEIDARALHFLAYADEKPVATARLFFEGEEAHIGRMAVLEPYRRQGVGRELLRAVLAEASRAERVTLNAQVHARNFYAAAGFVERGEAFFEAGILHIEMVKENG